MTVIRLRWYEVQVGATIGIARQMEAIRACLKDRHGFEDVGGALAQVKCVVL
jgi:hypothetical protein